MIKYIIIKNHKALVYASMMELGNINVICGKNNSGKTTILEALMDPKCHGIGKKLDNVEWLLKLFEPQANKWSNPKPTTSIKWFENYIEELFQEDTIWFSDDFKGIVDNIQESKSKNLSLLSHGKDIFDFRPMFDEFFRKSLEFYNPVLIPPKRKLEFQSNIDLNQELLPVGLGILNKLFYLKNQDLESDEYKVYSGIYETFSEITGSKFNIIPNKENQIKLIYNTDGNWIAASDSGLGLSDILIIISVINLMGNNIILLEEPENHLHAAYQKRLLEYIRSKRSKQFFITTHSSIFLDTNMVDKILYCSNNGEITITDQTSKSEIINSLGYSVTENLVADLIILLEGPTDVPVIREMLNWIGITSSHNIKFWPLGGDIMASLDLSVFAERKNVYALVDSDPGSKVQRTRFLNNCAKNGIMCRKLERYSLENYFSLQAIRKTFPDQIPLEIVNISPKKSVDAQIGFKAKNKTIKTKNEKIVKEMSIKDIEGTDLHVFLNDILSFFNLSVDKVLK